MKKQKQITPQQIVNNLTDVKEEITLIERQMRGRAFRKASGVTKLEIRKTYVDLLEHQQNLIAELNDAVL